MKLKVVKLSINRRKAALAQPASTPVADAPRVAVQDDPEHLRLLVEAMPIAIVVVDRRGNVILLNAQAEQLFGYGAEELLGRAVDVLVPERFRAGHPGLRTAYLSESTSRPMGAGRDLYGLRKDGTEVPIEIGLNPITTPQGDFVLAAIVDITERKRVEELRLAGAGMQQHNAELQALNRELESFTYSVSHDLRAPVRAVLGYARVIEEDYGALLDNEGRRLLSVVCDEASRMGTLIDELLAFSRLGRQPMQNMLVNMTALAREVVDEQTQSTSLKNLVVSIQDLPVVWGDRTLLRQVWENLISNAIKYASKQPVIDISIRGTSEAGRCVYHVRDNGVGFDMKYAGKLFGVFQRLHRNDEFPGTGVGLAIVQRIVNRHEGSVWADAALGSGATFSFALPEGHNS